MLTHGIYIVLLLIALVVIYQQKQTLDTRKFLLRSAFTALRKQTSILSACLPYFQVLGEFDLSPRRLRTILRKDRISQRKRLHPGYTRDVRTRCASFFTTLYYKRQAALKYKEPAMMPGKTQLLRYLEGIHSFINLLTPLPGDTHATPRPRPSLPARQALSIPDAVQESGNVLLPAALPAD